MTVTTQMHTYHATPAAVGELMDGGGEFLKPAVLIGDITEEQAHRKLGEAPYTLGQIVWHMHFWQARQIAALRGEKPPNPASLDATFDHPLPGEWQALVSRFLADIEEVKRQAEQMNEATSPFNDECSVPYGLAESALHNAYHFGQIALLRRVAGLWPPSGAPDGA